MVLLPHNAPWASTTSRNGRERYVARNAREDPTQGATERDLWLAIFRELVPKAKVELTREMLMRKASRKANLELAQQNVKESIESILRDSKRVGVLGGFKSYSDMLAHSYQSLLRVVDLVTLMGINSARQTAYIISSIVDAANSAAAICSNRAIQDEIVLRTRDITIDTAELLEEATIAANNKDAESQVPEILQGIQEQVREMLEILAGTAFLQEEMDQAKSNIELALDQSFRRPPEVLEESVTLTPAGLADRAQVLSSTIRTIANNACVTPEKLGVYSQQASKLMCELLEGTSIVAFQSGVDFSDPEYLAGTSSITPAKRLQMEGLLESAKGFAAATTNMIDLLKQIPRQEDDPKLQQRLAVTTHSADSALNSFVLAAQNVNSSAPPPTENQFNVADFDFGEDYVDAEVQVNASFREVESAGARFSVSSITYSTPELTRPVETASYTAEGEFPATVTVIGAAQSMCNSACEFMAKAAASQTALKAGDPFVYYKDPGWTTAMVDAANSMKDTTLQMYEVTMNPDSGLQDIVAAARCVNTSTARIVAYTRVKADTESKEQKELEEAAKNMGRAANFVIETARQAKDDADAEAEQDHDREMASLRKESQSTQIQKEFEAQAAIAKLEAELEEARQYLTKMREAVHGTF